MIFRQEKLTSGLYLVSTPIGNARDITLRALDVLASADVISAEDTRTARKLMEIHGVELRGRGLWAYHDHSSDGDRTRIVRAVESGQSVAYLSEAGTPLVADPGYKLVVEVQSAGGSVIAVPGASASLAALTVSGLGSDQFHFAGFLPSTQSARRATLSELASVPGTLIFYESGKRIGDLVTDLCDMLGETRQAALCRELTKRFETVERGLLADLAQVENREVRGEFVVVVGRTDQPLHAEEDIDMALRQALQTMRMKDAATAVAGAMGLNRRDVYQRALALKSATTDNGRDG